MWCVKSTKKAKTLSNGLVVRGLNQSDENQGLREKQTKTPYAPVHHIQNLESEGWQVAKMVSKTDAETGHQVGEPDYYVDSDAHCSLEERSSNAYMKELLLDRFGKDKLNMYYSLWLELRYEEYESKRMWASARKVSYKVLNAQITQIREVFKDNLEAFGH